jgi:hypothetical protein
MSSRRAEVLRQRFLASLLLVVALAVGCGPRGKVDPPAIAVPAAERAIIAPYLNAMMSIDGRSRGFGWEIAPGRHAVWIEYPCGQGSKNQIDVRLDMEFAAGHTYRSSGQNYRESTAKHCVFELFEEPTGRLICRAETRPYARFNRVTSTLGFEDEVCRAWSGRNVSDLRQALGDDLPWPPPVPQPIADVVAMHRYAKSALFYDLSDLGEWRNRDKQLRLRSEIGWHRPVFVVPHAVGLPGDSNGMVHGGGVLLRRGDPPPMTLRELILLGVPGTAPRPIDPAGIETGSLSLRLEPTDTYRTATIVVFFDDEAALDRFVARLRSGRPLTLDLGAEPGWTIRYWDADDVLQPPRDGWRP